MLSTNIIAMYLNDIYGRNYDIGLLDYLTDKFTSTLNEYDKYPYYLTATHKCHPNYGKYLADNNVPNDVMDSILDLIPDSKKMIFNKEFIQDLYKENFLKCLRK